MSAQIINGRAIANQQLNQLTQTIQQYTQQGLRAPGLDVILVGGNPASQTYVHIKEKACQQIGIISTCHRFPEHTSQETLESTITELNHKDSCDGILLQLPLPKHLDATPLLEKIDPNKDVDGFHPFNVGLLATRQPRFRPCTPFGVIQLLNSTGVDIKGSNTVIIGASNIVGRPMALEMLLEKATVTICHRFTKDLKSYVELADILISAAGHPNIIPSEWIKPGAVLIDVGFNTRDNKTITGDFDFDTAKERASWITPVPGGVGPMTVATLMANTVQAYRHHLPEK